MSTEAQPRLTQEEKTLIDRHLRIEAIKSIRERLGIGLAEALEITKEYLPLHTRHAPVFSPPAGRFSDEDETALSWLRGLAQQHHEPNPLANHAIALLNDLLKENK